MLVTLVLASHQLYLQVITHSQRFAQCGAKAYTTTSCLV